MALFASLVLFAGDAAETAAFYRALGLNLRPEVYDDGPVHWAADADGVHVAVLDAADQPGQAPPWRAAGSSFPGFYVESLDQAVDAVTDQVQVEVLARHQPSPWGCRAVVTDPDGRPVAINEIGHCPG